MLALHLTAKDLPPGEVQANCLVLRFSYLFSVLSKCLRAETDMGAGLGMLSTDVQVHRTLISSRNGDSREGHQRIHGDLEEGVLPRPDCRSRENQSESSRAVISGAQQTIAE